MWSANATTHKAKDETVHKQKWKTWYAYLRLNLAGEFSNFEGRFVWQALPKSISGYLVKSLYIKQIWAGQVSLPA